MTIDGDTRGLLNPRRGERHFSLVRPPAGPAVADHVAHHWVVHWALEEPFTSEQLPHPCVNLVLQDGELRAWGLSPAKDERHLSGTGHAVATKLRPGAFKLYAPEVDQAWLAGRSLNAAEAFGADGSALQAQMVARDGDPPAQLAAMEAFLAARRPDADPTYDLICAVIDDMLRRDPATRVDELAADHGVSTRTLQRAFATYVGQGPKWVLRRYRLHLATDRIAAGEVEDLSRLAADLGYFDLPHLTHDFRAAVGVTPAEFLRACQAAAPAAA
jgi:AraC-like DNA-binding protein